MLSLVAALAMAASAKTMPQMPAAYKTIVRWNSGAGFEYMNEEYPADQSTRRSDE